MKKHFKLSHILFYLFSAAIFFILGLIFAGISGAGKDQGLAGGAIVLGYGVMTGFIAFLLSIFVARFFKEAQIVLSNKIFAGVFVILFLMLTYRYYTQHSNLEEPTNTQNIKLATMTVTAEAPINMPDLDKPPMGLGMAKPNFFDNKVLYFYGNPNLEKTILDHTPTDSLLFIKTELGMEISYAPPWFVPAHLKLDYDILYIRVISIQSDFIEVLVNESNGQTSYMDRSKNKLYLWPEFLLTINSVDPVNHENNPVRVKPLSHAGLVSNQHYAFLKPIRISNQWIQVEMLDDAFNFLGKGWIKWRENDRLLISYSLLS